MLDFGDDLAIESYRIPWLIWIQILVLFLLILLLFCFSLSTSDLSLAHVTSSASSSSSSSKAPSSSSSTGFLGLSHKNSHFEKHAGFDHNDSGKTAVTNRCQYNQVGERRSIEGEIATTTGRRVLREDNPEKDTAPAKDATHLDHHPCNYFRIARLAFLKCLGLDCLCENPSSSERKKER